MSKFVKRSDYVKHVRRLRVSGLVHFSTTGEVVPARAIKPPCNCRMECSNKISEKRRQEIHRYFWDLPTWEQKRTLVAAEVSERPKNRSSIDLTRVSRRRMTRTYSLQVESGLLLPVCKIMYLHTYDISESFVEIVLSKKSKNHR